MKQLEELKKIEKQIGESDTDRTYSGSYYTRW